MKKILLMVGSTSAIVAPITGITISKLTSTTNSDDVSNVETPTMKPDDTFDWHNWDREVANADRDPNIWYSDYATPTYSDYDHDAVYEKAKTEGWTSEEYQKFLRYVHERTRMPDQGKFGFAVTDADAWIALHWGIDESRMDTAVQLSTTSPRWNDAFKPGRVGENEKQLEENNASSTWHAFTGGTDNFWLFDDNNYENAWLRLIDQGRLVKAEPASIANDDSYLTDPDDENSRVTRNKYMVNGEVLDSLPLGKTFYYVSPAGDNEFVRDYNGWKVLVTDEDKGAVYSEVLNPAPISTIPTDVNAYDIKFSIASVGEMTSITSEGVDYTWDKSYENYMPSYNSWTVELDAAAFNSANEHLSASFEAISDVKGTKDGFTLDAISQGIEWESTWNTTYPFKSIPEATKIGELTITPDVGYEYHGNGLGQPSVIDITLGDLDVFQRVDYNRRYYALGHNSYDYADTISAEFAKVEVQSPVQILNDAEGMIEKPVRWEEYTSYGTGYNTVPEYAFETMVKDLGKDSSWWNGKYILTNKETGDSAMDALDKMVQEDWYSFPLQFFMDDEMDNAYGRTDDTVHFWYGKSYSWAFVENGNGGYKLWKDANMFGVDVVTSDWHSNIELKYRTPQVLYGTWKHLFLTETIWKESSQYTEKPW